MPPRTPGRPSAPAPEPSGRDEPAAAACDEAPSLVLTEPAARVVVDAREPPEHLFRTLLSAYLGGARVFEVTERPRLSAASRNVVREFCRRTRQPTVVEDEPGRLVLEDAEPEGAADLEERLRHLGGLVVRAHRAAVDSWAALPLGDGSEWARRDDEVDREAWSLEREVARAERGTGARPARGVWTIARSLERIADHAVTLGEVGPHLLEIGSGSARVRELRQFHRQAIEHLEEVLADPDGARANDLLDVGEALLAAGAALDGRLLPAVEDGRLAPAAAAAVARALEAIGRTIAYTQDIAQAFFDHAVVPAFPVEGRTLGRTVALPG